MSADLHHLMVLVAAQFPNDSNTYPALAEMGGEQRTAWLINHSLQHMRKTLGEIAAVCESVDHGAALDRIRINRAVAKMLINTLKLASDLELTPEMLLQETTTAIGATAAA